MDIFDTDKLISELYNTNLKKYLEKYTKDFKYIEIYKYLNYLIDKSEISKSEIIQKTDINKFYAYQILKGMKNPARNKVLPFVFALNLDLDEAQKMLRCCNYPILNPRFKRDSVIIYGIIHKMNLMQVNEILFDNNLDLLG